MNESKQQEHDLRVLGEAIRGLREQQGVSAGELAAAAGVAQTDIAALEDGRLDPDLELLAGLADGIGVRLVTLFLRAERAEQGWCAGVADA
jgi:transcriptional regulator with XRE-family HTH domain